jgi:hypothetical protein
MLVLEYSLTKEDYIKFNYYTAWESPEKKSYRIKYWFKMALYIAIGVSIPPIIEPRPLTFENILPLAGVFVIFLFLTVHFYTKVHIKKAVERFLNQRENAHVLSKSHLIISDNGIDEINQVSEVKYKWEAIKNKVESKDYWYLYINSNYALVIPKRFLNENEKLQLSSFLSKNLPLTSEFKIK